MTTRPAVGKPLRRWIALVLVCLGAPAGVAAEPARQFLAGLRERGYHDMAVEYLEQMKTSPLAPVELKETLLYELGVTLIEASRDQRDMKVREAQLDEAAQALQRFVGMMPDHPLVTSANSQLGNLRVERARIKVEQSKQPGARAREKLLAEAATIYADAYTVFQRAQAELRERLEQLTNIAPDDRKSIDLRDMLRTEYLQAQLLAAAVKEETADTVKPGSPEYQELLKAAAEEYREIHEKYRTWLAGLYARMYQGRCSQKLGNYKEALSYYGELLEQPDNPEEFRTLKTKTLLLAMECWRASDLHAEAVAKLGTWIGGARPNEARDDEWLQLRLGLARAQWAFAQDLKSRSPRDAQVRRSESEARKNAQFVSRASGSLQREARQFLAEIGIESPSASGDTTDPTNFAEARQAGRDALDSLQTANLLIRTLPGRIDREKDDAVKEDLRKQLQNAQQTVETAVDDSQRLFRLALALADEDTDVRDLNIVRYFLCYLYYTTDQYLEAAVLGEFLARRYPDSAGARQGAKIAMAAYLKLYGAGGEDRQFETDQVISIARYIVQRWPNQEEAIDALNALIPLMIQAGDLDAAERYLRDIPEDSPQRGDAEIKTGQAMWSSYLRGMQELRKHASGDEEIPADFDAESQKQRLDDLKTRAERILVDGIARMQKVGKATEASLTAALSLAQIYLDTEQTNKSIELLENPTIGPLALVRKNDPAASRDTFAAETYKTSLRAYISSLPGAADPDGVIKNASDVMDAMKQTIEHQQLIGIYYSLARDLEGQMTLASAENKQALSKGFETFLLRLRSTSTDFAVLNWVAETFAGIAASFDTQSRATAEARRYYELAEETYQDVLQNGKIEDERLRIQVRLKLAGVQRRLNRFTAARDIFIEILKDNPGMINVQVEAARLYQDWASFDREELYLRSIQGGEIDPSTQRPILWGWQGIATRTASQPQFRAVFHEARYNLAVSLHRLALAKAGSEREKYLEMAGRTIRQTQQLFGTGEEWETWKPRYDTLLKNIQQALGQKTVGLDVPAVARTD